MWQGSLAGSLEPAIDHACTGIRRYHLDTFAWVDHLPGWVQGGDTIFAELVRLADWVQPDVPMYGRVLTQPRLSASWPRTDALPIIEDMRAALSERYGVEFTSVGLNLYRDGRDSVAWHGDRIPEDIVDPIVAIVSLGQPRRFLLRHRTGGPARRFSAGDGDLLVMGGASQRTWQHAVPKVAAAGPRMSVTFRHR